MKTMKKIVAILAVALMLCSILPLSVFAADGDVYELVTDVNNLAVGDKIIIVAKEADFAMSTNQKTNNRGAQAITKNNNTITWVTGVQEFTLEAGTVDGTFALFDGAKYLYAASSSSNHLKSQATNNANGSWQITIAADGTASIVAPSSTNRNVMQYNPNNGTPLFACYASASQKAMQIYKLMPSGACTHGYANCEDTTCDLCGNERIAPGHVWDSCESTVCSNCSATRAAIEHGYSNDYDADCNNCGIILPLEDATVMPLDKAAELGVSFDSNVYSSDIYYVSGSISEIANTTYGNIYIKDENDNSFYLYGLYTTDNTRYDKMTVKPVVNDIITVYGAIGNYNGTAQIKNSVMVYHEKVVVDCTEHKYADNYDANCDVCGAILPLEKATLLPLVDAIALGASMNSNTYTTDVYYVTGVISEVYNEQYGNMYIVDDADNTLTIYGSYNADGTISYSSMDPKPVAGNIVTILGSLGQFNGAAQIKNGWIVDFSVVETPDCEHNWVAANCTTAKTCSICGETEGEALGHNYVDGECDVCGAVKPNGYAPITSANQLVSGQYILVVENGYAPTYLDGSWVLAGQPTITDGVIADGTGFLWTLTVDGDSVIITDANGASIAPKGGNNNGVINGEYAWTWAFADGLFTFAGNGEDTVYLAANAGSEYKFRGYKQATVTGSPNGYPYQFTLYAVSTTGGEEECAHEYDNACDVDCNLCYEAREVVHSVKHVAAAAATCVANGNIEYWYCDVCGMAWLNAECTLNTNLRAVVLPATGEHTYDNDQDADCNVCGETREVATIIYGDANSDGEVTARDAALLQQYVAGWEVTLNMTSADANGDGEVTARDAALLQQFVAGWEVTLGA